MTTEKEDEPESAMERFLKPLIHGIALLLVLVLGAYIVSFSSAKVSHDSGDWGTLGDYFGGLMNPVISFATLVVAYSVWKQQKEELRQTKEALEEQAKTAEQQRREQRFFDLLNLYQQALTTLEVGGLRGRSAFTYQFDVVDGSLKRFTLHGFDKYTHNFNRTQNGLMTRESIETSVTQERLSTDWNSYSPSFDHYFRTIFSILREAEPTLQSDHFRYVKLLRAQIGRDELMMLGFNSWLDSEGEKMIPYLCKYGLLKHLAQGRLRQELEARLPAAVFGRRWARSRESVGIDPERALTFKNPITPPC